MNFAYYFCTRILFPIKTDPMKHLTKLTLAAAMAALTLLPAQAKKEKVTDADGNIIKTGFSFGALPAVSYSTDMGLQMGLIVNLFHYGDGSRYPTYDHSLYMEGSWYTKGTYVGRIYYDSDRLIKGIHSFIDVGFIGNPVQDFYGFNGYSSKYTLTNEASRFCDRIYGEKNSTGFYDMSQKRLYLQGDFSGNVGVKNLNWLGGIGFYNYWINSLDYETYDKMDPGVATLYETYRKTGIINEKEADGGFLMTLRGGLSYDSRNAQTNPSRGIYTEAFLEWALPGVSESPYLAYSIIHRQYIPIAKPLTFAYRLAAQGTIGNNRMPFYRMSQMLVPYAKRSMTMGVGGGYTVRGVLQNRMVGDAVSYANFELRWKVVSFNIGRQSFYVGLNPFFDAGYTLSKVDIDEAAVSAALAAAQLDTDKTYPLYSDCFTGENDGLHMSAGCGLKIAMNENFVLSADFGKAFKKTDNDGLGVYVQLNYLF